jgi:hypothetical protein
VSGGLVATAPTHAADTVPAVMQQLLLSRKPWVLSVRRQLQRLLRMQAVLLCLQQQQQHC